MMKIGEEEREVTAGDLVYTPPDTAHSIWPVSQHAPLRGLAFAIGTPGAGKVDYS
jgi:mannose-6-phosphate isomerase-like protein (cupin superfamily)